MLPRAAGTTDPGLRWLAIAALTLSAAFLRPPLLIPESLELVATGRCLLGLPSAAPPCSDLDLFFWSPGYPVLSALGSLVLDPVVAAGLVSLLSFAALLAVAGRLAERLGGIEAWWATVMALGVSSTISSYAMVIDARALGLALTTGAVLAALPADAPPSRGTSTAGPPQVSRRAAVLAGLLAAGAALTRPEHALIVAGVLVLLATSRLRLLAPAMVGLAPLAAWIGVESVAAGRFAPLPRSIQGVGFALTQVVPEPWARKIIGEGAASLPLRAAVQAGPWPQDLPSGFALDPLRGLLWVGRELGQLLPLWALLLSVFGLALAARTHRWRTVLAVLALASPGLAAVATPPGREAELPVATLLPVMVASLAAASVTARVAARAIAGRRSATWIRASLAGLLGCALGLASPALHFPSTPDNAPSGRAAAAELARRLPAGTPVAASFASSPVVHLAGMRWVPWPSPWESQRWLDPEDAPVAAVLTVADDAWSPTDPGLPDSLDLRPVAAYGELGTSVVLLTVEEAKP